MQHADKSFKSSVIDIIFGYLIFISMNMQFDAIAGNMLIETAHQLLTEMIKLVNTASIRNDIVVVARAALQDVIDLTNW